MISEGQVDRDEIIRLLQSYMGGMWEIANDQVLIYWRNQLYCRMWESVNP
jgi:hypothetical protein